MKAFNVLTVVIYMTSVMLLGLILMITRGGYGIVPILIYSVAVGGGVGFIIRYLIKHDKSQ
jgi:hypothetical protein